MTPSPVRRTAGRALPALAGVAALAVLTACGSTGGGGGSSSAGSPGPSSAGSSGSSSVTGTITVFAAASLTGTFTDLGKQFQSQHPGTTVKFNFGASSALATQITEGAKADVFASAAPGNMTTVTDAGEAGTVVTFAKNQMEVAVPADNPAKVASVNDLAKSGVKVALCQSQVPCGKTALEVFSNAKITVKPVTQEKDVKTTLAKITAGEVDAGVVYVTDVKAAGSKVKGIEIPAAVNASTDYPIAPIRSSANPQTAAAFVSFIQSATAQSVLKTAGFLSP